jgi:hypothetical protein
MTRPWRHSKRGGRLSKATKRRSGAIDRLIGLSPRFYKIRYTDLEDLLKVWLVISINSPSQAKGNVSAGRIFSEIELACVSIVVNQPGLYFNKAIILE